MDFTELQTMVILIEMEYDSEERNTPAKMSQLIKKEFDETVSKSDILEFYNIGYEDYERENRMIEYDFRH